MPLVLVRIDDRLVHGQVVVGWGNVLHPDRILLCNDQIAASPWERELYTGGTTDDAPVEVLSLRETAERLIADKSGRERLFLIVESPKDVLRLLDLGVPITEVNVGGMHHRPGKRQVAPYLFVDEQDRQWFKELHARRVALVGQDVPTGKKLDVAELLNLD
ncbi:MAG: PTS sugar transporter subunit IIB [candidate division KSB1 bacterium]|nr:PTS sugar transporter subunit IIB [candidate division KSB1 bacterium]